MTLEDDDEEFDIDAKRFAHFGLDLLKESEDGVLTKKFFNTAETEDLQVSLRKIIEHQLPGGKYSSSEKSQHYKVSLKGRGW